jgi:hypothetical protein
MKERYIALMEKALSAYTDAHIVDYFERVKREGLTEHGFPRLTADIGILISHGYRRDLLPLFLEMMDFCCHQIPRVHAANDFSVREIVCCIREVENAGVVDADRIEKWKAELSACDPYSCYDVIAKSLTDTVRNWALFSGVSEYYRQAMCGGDSEKFVEMQFGQQLQWFDENGMYCDNKHSDSHQHIMYDLAPRFLYSLAIHLGYRGRYFDRIDALLKKSGLLTLDMQSVTGEMAFGGRSNQFYLNEGTLCSILEFEASRYAKDGNTELAGRFKAAAQRALENSEWGLSAKPIYHIKNRFPTETKYGCENYAYFDKYMITVASNYYGAYLMCDDSIPTAPAPDHEPTAFMTSYHFHKLFLKSGGYSVEYDLNGDPHYDASGLGRVHREGAPSAICISCPCPARPVYTLDIETPFAFSMCSAIRDKDGWRLGAEECEKHEALSTKTDKDSASATVICRFDDDRSVKEHYTVNENGVSIKVEGDGEIGYSLPAFCFDGEISPKITVGEHSLTVSYDGWTCKYTTSGTIIDLNKIAANRNGHYRTFIAKAENTLDVKVEIVEE